MGHMSTTRAAHAFEEFTSTAPGALTVAVVLGLVVLAVVFAMR